MVTASQVKELREKTGAGMMDCKKVLTEADGDMEKAIELLRERGIAKAAKKSDRVAAEGLVDAYISEDGKVGAVVEVNAETDFVSSNAEFKSFVADIAKQIARQSASSQLGGGAEAEGFNKTLSSLDINVLPKFIFYVVIFMSLVLLVSLIISSFNILRKNPKELLIDDN